ncbi:perlucin-like protein isoform X2 [Mytilus trossulus]|uniref:perlucin-like protein isoform X2 n=1 Tax=Mytilus trossulus TaxID=6551 RepID=UPI003006DFC2
MNKVCAIILCTLSVFFFPNEVNAECPLGWVHYDISCFLFSTNALNWYNAHGSCRAHSARIAEVNSVDVMAYLRQMAKSYGYDYWLGGRDDVIEGFWQWSSTGENFTVSDWAPGEPDDASNSQDCLLIWKSADYQWDDQQCTTNYRYICESEYPGEAVIG